MGRWEERNRADPPRDLASFLLAHTPHNVRMASSHRMGSREKARLRPMMAAPKYSTLEDNSAKVKNDYDGDTQMVLKNWYEVYEDKSSNTVPIRPLNTAVQKNMPNFFAFEGLPKPSPLLFALIALALGPYAVFAGLALLQFGLPDFPAPAMMQATQTASEKVVQDVAAEKNAEAEEAAAAGAAAKAEAEKKAAENQAKAEAAAAKKAEQEKQLAEKAAAKAEAEAKAAEAKAAEQAKTAEKDLAKKAAAKAEAEAKAAEKIVAEENKAAAAGEEKKAEATMKAQAAEKKAAEAEMKLAQAEEKEAAAAKKLAADEKAAASGQAAAAPRKSGLDYWRIF